MKKNVTKSGVAQLQCKYVINKNAIPQNAFTKLYVPDDERT